MTWLQAFPGTGAEEIVSQLGVGWTEGGFGLFELVQCWHLKATAEIDPCIEALHPGQDESLLVLFEVFLPVWQILSLTRTAHQRGWRSVLVVSPVPAPERTTASIAAPHLSVSEARLLLGGRLSEPLKDLVISRFGGHFGALKAVADLAALLPDNQLDKLLDDTCRLFELAPQGEALASQIQQCLEVFAPLLRETAEQWGCLGLKLEPAELLTLFGPSALEAASMMEQAHLVQRQGELFAPLSHFVWAVRSRGDDSSAASLAALSMAAAWRLRLMNEESFAEGLVFERRSPRLESLGQALHLAWKQAHKLQLSLADGERLSLAAACTALLSDDLQSAEEILSIPSEGPDVLPGASDLLRGIYQLMKGREDLAVPWLLTAIESARRGGLKDVESAGFYWLGSARLSEGELVQAELALRQGIEAAAHRSKTLLPRLMDLQAFVVGLQGRTDESLKLQIQSVLLWEESDHSAAAALAKSAYARICWLKGQPEFAESEIVAALPALMTCELLDDVVNSCFFASAACLAQGEPKKALGYVSSSLPHFRTSGSRVVQALALMNRCWAHMALGETDLADDDLKSLTRGALLSGGRVALPALLTLHSARAVQRGEWKLAALLRGAADFQRAKGGARVSQGERQVTDAMFLKAREVLGSEAYEKLLFQGARTPAEELLLALLLDRHLLLQGASPSELLTAREQQVLKLLSSGCSNLQIARELGVALGTVKTVVHRVKAKLRGASRRELAELGRLPQAVQESPGHAPAKPS